MKKTKLLAITMSILMIAGVAGCSQGTKPTESAAPTTAAPTTAAPATAAESSAAETEKAADADAAEKPAGGEEAAEGTLTGPYIVTSCGQSPGAVMVNMVAMQEGLTSVNDNGLSADTFSAGDAKTLIITTGTSMKGMGAAGTDVDSEIKRCVELIGKAKEAGLTIVGAHVEGMARRVDSSDTASIEAVMELADIILVIDDSDSDGYFTQYAADNSKPLIKVKDTLEISTVLK